MARTANGRVTVRAVRLTEPLNVDGVLDEAVYQTPPITGFLQIVPLEGQPATERTDAWVFYDDDNIYLVCRCWDSAPPEEWIANEMRRDAQGVRENDFFGALFDTFHDRRNGFNFYTNPLAARADQWITDEGSPNRDWNTVWSVRTGRFEGGWTAELAIPFKSLRYRSGEDQTWGIQIRRGIRRKSEFVYLTFVPASAGGGPAITRVSAAADLVGLDLPPAGRNIEIKPYAISGRANYRGDRYGLTADYTVVGDNFNPEVGLVRRDDFRRYSTSARFSPRPRSIEWIRQFRLFVRYERIESLDGGVLETEVWNGGPSIEFENSDQLSVFAAVNFERLEVPLQVSSAVSAPVGDYDFKSVSFQYGFGAQRRVSGSFSFQIVLASSTTARSDPYSTAEDAFPCSIGSRWSPAFRSTT